VHDPEAQPTPEADPTTTPGTSAGDPTRSELSHELGNRLAAIVAFSHLIRTDPRLPDDLHDQAELLEQEAARTRELVERILDSGVSGSPSSARPASAVGVEPDAAAPVTGARILVVDDEPAIREFLARILVRLGHEPLLASGGAEALAIVRSSAPDAILCDHRMGAMSGATFNDAVAEVAPDLARHFAFMTGDVTNPEIRSVAAARGISLLAKPFDIQSVERIVAAILES
jgi:CheY-like chemotaxis protein